MSLLRREASTVIDRRAYVPPHQQCKAHVAWSNCEKCGPDDLTCDRAEGHDGQHEAFDPHHFLVATAP